MEIASYLFQILNQFMILIKVPEKDFQGHASKVGEIVHGHLEKNS
jgi:hypothetical protein